ncbi:AraC-like DNA-binding protein [Paeniglutamicibacter psychrophenolicus]|uniref:AraC-like DNA-binding protein n=1 Tax=Paeniglutamicibacter psychrophenolicus TaxID=257454 RepID=A0ABS4WHL4_9MICC|nr:AraC-like DNA-binding protein [Paeniglutamicibacter psychrophenolicus]
MERTAARNLGSVMIASAPTGNGRPSLAANLVEARYSLTTGNRSVPAVPPDGLTGLVLIEGRIWWLGPQSRPWRPERSGVEVVGVRIAMHWGQAIAGEPLNNFLDARIAVEELPGWPTEPISENRLLPGTPADHLTAMVNDRASHLAVDPWIPRIAGRIRAGEHSVAELADISGLSVRQLHRRCLTYFGLPPSILMRISRLHRAAARVPRLGNPDLSNLAVATGYFDQSHLNRETRQLAGEPPTKAFAVASNVRFVQYPPSGRSVALDSTR